jgi:hypothetical protein
MACFDGLMHHLVAQDDSETHIVSCWDYLDSADLVDIDWEIRFIFW